eukprot:7252705-Karenia_brevis.AAC.1
MSLIKSAIGESMCLPAFVHIFKHLYGSQILVAVYNGLDNEEILRLRPRLHADAEGAAAG